MIILCLEPGTMEFKYEKDRIYLVNQVGECIAEVTFPQISENEVNINHTLSLIHI